jgi:hypothetical protein
LRRRTVVGAAIAAAMFFVVARLKNPALERLLGGAITKLNGGWIAFLFTGCAVVVGFAVCERLSRSRIGETVVRPLALLGRKGLPGYAAMVLALLALDELPGVPRNDLTVAAVVSVCGLAELAAVRFDAIRRARRRPGVHRRHHASGDSPPIAVIRHK